MIKYSWALYCIFLTLIKGSTVDRCRVYIVQARGYNGTPTVHRVRSTAVFIHFHYNSYFYLFFPLRIPQGR